MLTLTMMLEGKDDTTQLPVNQATMADMKKGDRINLLIHGN